VQCRSSCKISGALMEQSQTSWAPPLSSPVWSQPSRGLAEEDTLIYSDDAPVCELWLDGACLDEDRNELAALRQELHARADSELNLPTGDDVANQDPVLDAANAAQHDDAVLGEVADIEHDECSEQCTDHADSVSESVGSCSSEYLGDASAAELLLLPNNRTSKAATAEGRSVYRPASAGGRRSQQQQQHSSSEQRRRHALEAQRRRLDRLPRSERLRQVQQDI
jgi:hypothetical protein